jgi:hypothetical protein
VVAAAGISFFAPAIDGTRNAELDDPRFAATIEHALREGRRAEPALLGASPDLLAVGRVPASPAIEHNQLRLRAFCRPTAARRH